MKPIIMQTLLTKKTLSLICMLLIASALAGCESNVDHSGSTSSSGTGSIGFNVVWNSNKDMETDYQIRALPCGFGPTQVNEVMAVIYKADYSVEVEGGPWECAASSGTIPNVPVGTGYIIAIYGLNSDWLSVYRGDRGDISVEAGPENSAGTINADLFETQSIEPPDGAVNIDPDNAFFSWSHTTDAIEYELVISEYEDLSYSDSFYTESLSYTVPSGTLEAGTLYYWTVYPLDENYFWGYNSIRSFTTASGISGPNLTAMQYSGNSSFSVNPGVLVWGQRLDINWAITNNGTEAIPAGTDAYMFFYLSTNTIFTQSDYLLGMGWLDPIYYNGLNQGSGLYGTTPWQLPSSSPFSSSSGTFYIGIVIDAYDVVAETNEDDNSGTGVEIDYAPVNIAPFY